MFILQKDIYPSITLKSYMTSIIKPLAIFIVCSSSIVGHAAILNDSERRIQVRHSSSNAYVAPSTNTRSTVLGGDSMQGLIEQKQREYEFEAKLSIEENKRVNVNTRRPNYNTSSIRKVTYNPKYNTASNTYNSMASIDFDDWLNSNSFRAQEVANYHRYLSAQIGAQNVPPLEELLTTARSWDKCGYEPYQLPPQELWSNIVPTLRLYTNLKNQGILPASSKIRSVYRSPGLNGCAGGANNSKHMTAGAIDIWVPEYANDFWQLSNLQDNLCQYWQYQGQSHNFGLGLYSTGAIHLDTQGYRKWGFHHTSSSSSCRY
ncbi:MULTISPECIES: D-Ala-D-Ala carboxypeptidase family metallohydrolase [unclassified Psychrobacter]|uniref:D-Ala-D-Ala carboxypeptidase family metallohydrolase n=1 Tax=unclassified Psychrobacter TaxID=196806 RepID=UPI001D0D61BC|nr:MULTISPECIES: D-Ala-D-Ala carboxypeptidase family metallohydrolase [unclassified Psychrobacter]